MTVDPHLLRTFAAIARTGSFSQAARELGYTQSAVSQHIAALEADLGTVLLTRRPVALTPAGTRLLEHAVPLLLRLDAARADVRRLAATSQSHLTVATTPLAGGALGEALAEVRRRFPTTEITVRTAGREAVVRAVAEGGCDLALVDGVAAPSDPLRLDDVAPMTSFGVAEDELAIVLPPGHPLAGRAALELADLAEARWVDAPDVAIPPDRLRTLTGSTGFRAGLRYAGQDVLAVVALVAAGHGLALLPAPLAGPGVALAAPRLVHRTEVLHGALAPGGPAHALRDALGG